MKKHISLWLALSCIQSSKKFVAASPPPATLQYPTTTAGLLHHWSV